MPADCLMIEGDEIQADESSITGESENIKKFPMADKQKHPNPFLLNDSMIVLGKCTAVVCAVGINT